MQEIQLLGQLNVSLLAEEFGDLFSDEVIVTNERLLHIQNRHPEDFQLFCQYGKLTAESPDIIIKDEKIQQQCFL